MFRPRCPDSPAQHRSQAPSPTSPRARLGKAASRGRRRASPENVNGVEGCSSTYPNLPDSATETCTTEATGECQLIAEEGTIEGPSEVEDTITLTAPTDYSVTKVKGCHSESGSPEAPVCHVLLKEFSQPSTVTFELKPWPVLTVDVGGPKSLGLEAAVDNELADGQVVTVQQINPSSGVPEGEAHTCKTANGVEGRGLSTGTPASCGVQVPEGEYTVTIPEEWTIPANAHFTAATVYVSGADENIKKVKLNLGATATESFSTSFIPDMEVKVGGPKSLGFAAVENELADGQKVIIQQIEPSSGEPVGEARSCTSGNGVEGTGLSTGTPASCGVQVPEGEYIVKIPEEWTAEGDFLTTHVFVSGADENIKKVGLNRGGTATESFSTSFIPDMEVDVGGPKSLGFAAVDNELADGQVVTIQQIDPSSGEPVGEAHTCKTANGVEGTGLSTGTPASCGVQVPEGEYTVTIPEEWTIPANAHFTAATVYVSGADENIKKVGLNRGGTATESFSTSFIPDMEVDVGGPKSLGFAAVDNELADGQVVTIQQIDPSSGEPVGEAHTCKTANGVEGTGLSTGTPASCGLQVPEGEYTVTIPEEWTIPANAHFTAATVYVSGAGSNIKKVGLNRGGTATESFSTSFIPDLEVDVGGPDIGVFPVDEDANGQVVAILPIDGTPGKPTSCTAGGGYADNTTASCGSQLLPGTYQVSVPQQWTPTDGDPGVYVTGDENVQDVTLNAGNAKQISFSTAYLNLTDSGSGSGSATTTDGKLSATGSGGSGTVTVGEYSSNPEGVPAFDSAGKYIDVYLAPGNTFTSLTFTDCELSGGAGFEWWNPQAKSDHGGWEAVSDETSPSGTPPCITVTINESTSPTLKQLTGTVFGVVLPPASTSSTSSMTPPQPVPAVSASAAIGRVTGAIAKIAVACSSAPCSGTVTLSIKKTVILHQRKKRTKRKTETLVLGRGTFSLSTGASGPVSVKLDAKGRALLAKSRAHRLVVTETLTVVGGKTVTKLVTIELAKRT